MQKAIALLDLDYFYAQCEELRKPEIKGKPVVIVMPSLRENSGAIATANYLAREQKIKSGMPLQLAKKLASKDTVFINADKEYYKEISSKVFEIVDFMCDKVEQVSIDEAYMDLTSPLGFEKAEDTCTKIKEKIKSELGLTCSIGLSTNKFLAKLASNEKKPDGLFILRESVEKFLEKKKIRELFGVGPKFEKLFKSNGVNKIGDIKKHSKKELIDWFGEAKGVDFHNFAFGIDERGVEPNREKKQVSRMITLKSDSRDFEYIFEQIKLLSDLVFIEASKIHKKFKTGSLVIVNSNFETITKSKSKTEINSLQRLIEIEEQLLRDFLDESLSKVRRVGVRISNFEEGKGLQKTLFDFKK
ncbi:MAG: DNA polymerase IV [Candidatus Diapherotrites archaeon]|jgi:DNA polymerase IV (archaeal DinB-like DNA polymerase)|uniref:DNA polymerase IV n=1 Tax=Candidatus Iainarchaeum sp. TaxID=3101447 RepID=A0A8T5GFA3_9ARCH|nr:DNA polymerase IV [Candidatus Diapherotrites archaeon]